MAKQLIAYCGLDCADCAAYKATKANDNAARKQIADEWNNKYGFGLKVKDVNCDGCLPVKGGRLLNYCATCEVRECARDKDVKNCAYCAAYACTKLTSMPWFETKSKPRLDNIRENLKNKHH